jgi:hypothetical protein
VQPAADEQICPPTLSSTVVLLEASFAPCAAAEKRERARLRDRNSTTVLGVMTEVLGSHFREVSIPASCPPDVLAKRIEESKGLVAAYVSQTRAQEVVSCCQAILGGEISTNIWFDEKNYMGAFAASQLRLPALVELAMRLEDRVFAAPIAGSGLLIIDYYPQPWPVKQADFSVILQGPSVEPMFESCFS